MTGLADEVMDYFVSLIVGVILLYVLWEVVLVIAADIPELYRYGIAIAIAAAVGLIALARRGINW